MNLLHVLELIYPPGLYFALTLLLLALLLDYTYPYHRGILLKVHPVHTCYVLSQKMIRPYASRAYGVFLASSCIILHLAQLYAALYFASLLPNPWAITTWLIAALWFMKTSFSLRLLLQLGFNVYNASRTGDWIATRHWVQQMVRRNVYRLDEKQVLSASIESLAESLVDGFVSPLFYYTFLGVLGPMLQRLANTLDGSVGFKTPMLRDQGWFSARLDTLLNYVPARLTALYIILSAMILGFNWKRAWRIYLRDHGLTESLNAGHPMSAMAGALGVVLEKPGYYRLGEEADSLSPGKVLDATRIVLASAILHLAVTIGLLALFYYFLYPVFL